MEESPVHVKNEAHFTPRYAVISIVTKCQLEFARRWHWLQALDQSQYAEPLLIEEFYTPFF